VERHGTAAEGGAGRGHIIDKDEPSAAHLRSEARTDGERATHVPCSLGPAQGMLRHGPFDAHQGSRHGETKMTACRSGQEFGLIEASFAATLGVDGHRHEEIATHAGMRPAPGQEQAQRLAQPPLAVVLQSMDGSSSGA